MNARAACCRNQSSLEELLADEMMGPVLRSAGLDLARFREMLAAVARRIAEIPCHPGDTPAEPA